jgi:hypothetical protein
MTLKQWAVNGWLRDYRSSAEEIGNLLAIVERDLKDAAEGVISADWRFGIAYNAVSSSVPFFFTLKVIRPKEPYSITAPFRHSHLSLGQKEKKIRTIWMPVDPKGILSNMIMSGVLQKTTQMNS